LRRSIEPTVESFANASAQDGGNKPQREKDRQENGCYEKKVAVLNITGIGRHEVILGSSHFLVQNRSNDSDEEP
jgi:hypothetical protein